MSINLDELEEASNNAVNQTNLELKNQIQSLTSGELDDILKKMESEFPKDTEVEALITEVKKADDKNQTILNVMDKSSKIVNFLSGIIKNKGLI